MNDSLSEMSDSFIEITTSLNEISDSFIEMSD